MMYCHKCGTRMPADSVFCAKCGTRLLTHSGHPGPVSLGILRRLNPKQVFFQKLAKILVGDEFRIDPRLLKKSDASKSVELATKMQGALVSHSLGLGPLGVLIGPLAKRLVEWKAISGEELYTALKGVAHLFNIIAVKYEFAAPIICVVVDSDGLDSSQAEDRADAFCKAVWTVAYKKNTTIFTNCLYVFFDEQQCAKVTPSILKNAYKRKSSWRKNDAYVSVWPIVANVPAQKLEYKSHILRNVISTGTVRGNWVISKRALRALVTAG